VEPNVFLDAKADKIYANGAWRAADYDEDGWKQVEGEGA
jgi:hypothetical protein